MDCVGRKRELSEKSSGCHCEEKIREVVSPTPLFPHPHLHSDAEKKLSWKTEACSYLLGDGRVFRLLLYCR